jgi:hypothetical protein
MAIFTDLATGVFTYVSDGVRGSSQAELIDTVGAAERLDSMVATLLKTIRARPHGRPNPTCLELKAASISAAGKLCSGLS